MLLSIAFAPALDAPGANCHRYTVSCGLWSKRYAYDGLGRLIETQSPYLGAGGKIARVEHFYYDGSRRIQEVVTDPVNIQYVYATYGIEGLVELLQNLPDLVTQQMECTTLGKEYVWGPGDGGAAGAQNGADELIAFYDQGWLDKKGDPALPWDQPWYLLRDLDGDNVAIVDTHGAASGQNAHLLTLAAEWRYDAYGSVNWSRIHESHPILACGHRGVFFDRLDEPVIRFAADAASGDSTLNPPSLGESWDTRVLVEPQVAGAGFDLPTGKPKIIGHMRNREYLPHLMRFAQRDPNATGQLVMAAVSYSGRALSGSPSAMSLTGLYGDGGNLYAYLGGNPRGRADPTGLSWDPFAAVDEIVAEHAASQAAFMNKIIGGAHGAAILAATIASFLPFPGVSFAGEIALALMNGEPLDALIRSKALGLLPGGSWINLILELGPAVAGAAVQGVEFTAELAREMEEYLGGGGGGGGLTAGSKTDKLFAGVNTFAGLCNVFASDSSDADHQIYVAKDKQGNEYIGISTDPVRRGKEHLRKDGKKVTIVEVIEKKVTKLQARGIETAGMCRFGSTDGTTIDARYSAKNKRRSIGPNRKFFQAGLSFGAQWLKENARHLY